MRDRKKRNIIIGSLCCLLVFMAVGYALLKQVLNINGTAAITGSWDIRITGIETVETVGTAENAKDENGNVILPTYTTNEATFSVGLKKPGDKIKYKVTVQNFGSIDAVLSIDSSTPTPHKDIKFTNDLISGEILYHAGIEQEEQENGIVDSEKKSIREFYIEVEFNRNAAEISEQKISQYKIELTYTQYDGNDFYEPPKDVETDNGVFQVSADGTILNYNEDLGTHVSIPAEIDDIAITTIASDAFKKDEIVYNYDFKVILNSSSEPLYGVAFNIDVFDELEQLAASYNIKAYVVGDPEIPEVNTSEGEMEAYYNMATGLDTFWYEGKSGFLGETKVIKVLAIDSLDLSNAINLEEIEQFAFSNARTDMTTDEINNLETGLTSLTFGNNTKEISFGMGAFAGADLDFLKVYTSATGVLKANEDLATTEDDDSIVAEGEVLRTILTPFGVSSINNLVIQPTDSITKISPDSYSSTAYYNSIFIFAKNVNSLTIEDGITTIPGDFLNHVVVENVSLPSTLTTIGDSAFTNTGLTNVNIPKSVTNIGDHAFDENPSLTITMLGRKNLDGMTLGSSWSGSATINYAG